MNLSQKKRERLLNFIKELKTNNSFDEKSLIELNEIENELNGKKYGLVWEEHEEAVDVQMKEAVPVFIEDKSREIVCDKDAPFNFLLEGDNLHSLYLLEKTHKGKIDAIYIDPPYNRGSNDFVYDDDYVNDDDNYRHSKWISFMFKRIDVAYKLLSEDGTIFISIDDNELYSLKHLCDAIFGENNFLGNVVWSKKRKGSFLSKGVISLTEYALVYAKNINKHKGLFGGFANSSESQPIIKRTNKNKKLSIKANLIETKLKDGVYKKGEYGSGVNPVVLMNDITVENGKIISDFEIKAPFTWSQEMFDYEISRGAKAVINTLNLQIRVFRPTDESKFKGFPSYIDGVAISGTNEDAYEELERIFNEKKVFDYSKPSNYIKTFLNAATYNKKEALILDFFAGSGTTGQSVLELNQEDGGNRSFILCTNNQNSICENITFQRLKTVVTGKRVDGSKYSDGLPTNLKYFKTDFVPKSFKNLSKELTKHVKELIELEWGVSIDKKVNLMVMTEDELDKIEANWDKLKTTVKSIYRARQVVYTGKQKQLFKNINNFIIPDYYFNNELKEVGENW